ncbi:MAG TPA: type I methionyl aminopeptidase [Candidatus Paceibacterota bacterium]|nr:type I methionyl aminopeptidase [Candidatus Paceibacterota bacterium]
MVARTQKEIEALREGGKRLAMYLKELAEMVEPGVTARELEDRALFLLRSGGDEPAFKGHKDKKTDAPYPSALCVSINDVIVHSPASDNGAVIQDGDVVKLDFGIKHKGLYTDHAVTVIAGETRDPEDEKMIRLAYEALDAGIAQARLGKTTGDIGYTVEQVARKNGLGYPKNLAGHGVGKAVHEEPHIPNFGAPGSGTRLVEGMVIAIEPMFARGSGELYVDSDGYSYRTKDGSRTAHVEHTVLVTKDGPEILTKA